MHATRISNIHLDNNGLKVKLHNRFFFSLFIFMSTMNLVNEKGTFHHKKGTFHLFQKDIKGGMSHVPPLTHTSSSYAPVCYKEAFVSLEAFLKFGCGINITDENLCTSTCFTQNMSSNEKALGASGSSVLTFAGKQGQPKNVLQAWLATPF